MSFYVTLPSNASMETFPSNTQSNFTTVLAKTINLNDRYQVGLAEISYTQTININIGTMKIVQNNVKDENNGNMGEFMFDLSIDDCVTQDQLFVYLNNIITDYYKTIYIAKNKEKFKDLSAMNEKFLIDRNIFMPRFKSFTTPDTFLTVIMPANTSVIVTGPIAEVLRFEKIEERPEIGVISFYEPIDPVIHFCDNFLLYTDIIADQLYGDVSSKIIRNVVPHGLHGDKVSISYESIHYVDLALTKINTININIRDAQGNFIHFNDKLGKVVIKLHFKLK